jgi:hypothetical protein
LIGIKCIGDVELVEDDDFSQWGIKILVKFRDTEKLQVLTGTRQSGGVCILPDLSLGAICFDYSVSNGPTGAVKVSVPCG